MTRVTKDELIVENAQLKRDKAGLLQQAEYWRVRCAKSEAAYMARWDVEENPAHGVVSQRDDLQGATSGGANSETGEVR